MMRKRQLLINALASVAQVVVTGGSFFVLYRFVQDTLGIEYLGVWSVVLATTSVSGLANLGLTNSAIKFVSMYLAREQEDRVALIVQTTVISLSIFLAVALAALYPVLIPVIKAPTEPHLIPAALEILPYALASFWLSATAGALLGCVDGYQRIDLRSALLTVTTLVYLALAFVLVPQNGLVGLAQAQVLQAGLLLVGAWLLIKRLLPALPILPYRWDRDVFKEMLGYSLNFQIISASKLLFEPLTKYLMMNFGGAEIAGYFEFAHRMVFQLRAFIVTAHQSVVPTIADLQERQPAMVRTLYATSYRLILYLILGALPLFIALTPLISRLWIGAYTDTFILFADLLFVGWFLNMLSNPAYFAYLGIGVLRWNVAGHLVIGLLNGLLGAALGWLYGATGVVVGFVIALITGSLVIAISYQRTYQIRLADLVQRESVWLGVAALAGMALALWAHDQFRPSWSLFGLIVAVPGLYGVLVIAPLWRHPARRQLQTWLTTLLIRRASDPTNE